MGRLDDTGTRLWRRSQPKRDVRALAGDWPGRHKRSPFKAVVRVIVALNPFECVIPFGKVRYVIGERKIEDFDANDKLWL
jgi:hypothetical protein